MSKTGIERRDRRPLKEKGQYAIAFSVIAAMLYAAGFPVFFLLFTGALAFFVWKVFTAEGRGETRRVFEFYLTANEILRDDDRRWFGFEVQEAISRGEQIIRSMSTAPPLVYFALGALYRKVGDHASALRCLSGVIDNKPSELDLVFPAKDLREYVRMLRRIERSPAEAPLTASAIRALERLRKNRGQQLLDESRAEVDKSAILQELNGENIDPARDRSFQPNANFGDPPSLAIEATAKEVRQRLFPKTAENRAENPPSNEPPDETRKTISEVLHDIYDRNAP